MTTSIRLFVFSTFFLIVIVESSSFVLSSNFKVEKSKNLFHNRHQMKFDLVSFFPFFNLQNIKYVNFTLNMQAVRVFNLNNFKIKNILAILTCKLLLDVYKNKRKTCLNATLRLLRLTLMP